MKRRDVLRSLAAVAGAATATHVEAQVGVASALSPSAVEELMRAHGLEPLPGEAIQIRSFLMSTRSRALPDPRIEPAIRLEPDVD